jgi:D-lactate dehydrogenase
MAEHTVEAMWRWSDGGRLPVVIDASSCTLGVKGLGKLLSPERAQLEALTVLDSLEFLHDVLLPRLVVDRRLDSVVVHSVCSVLELGLASTLQTLAGAVGETVVSPVEAGCCGFAGDRGWLHPELTASALKHEAQS